jgi:hypothetical protein
VAERHLHRPGPSPIRLPGRIVRTCFSFVGAGYNERIVLE